MDFPFKNATVLMQIVSIVCFVILCVGIGYGIYKLKEWIG